MNLHDQAVQDYSHIDNSNTLFILRGIVAILYFQLIDVFSLCM
jgi:hypothetical protein